MIQTPPTPATGSAATLHPHGPATLSNGHVESGNTSVQFQGKFGPESGGTATAAGSVLQIGTTDSGNTAVPFRGKCGPDTGGTATAAGSVLQIGTPDMVAIAIQVGKAKQDEQDEQEKDVISVLATKAADDGSR
jgi:hypothetical protein